MTNVDEISVAPQKNDGGLVSVYIKATIQGKSPREKPCPRTMNQDRPFDTPQFSAILTDRSGTDDVVTLIIEKAEIMTKEISICEDIFEIIQHSSLKVKAILIQFNRVYCSLPDGIKI